MRIKWFFFFLLLLACITPFGIRYYQKFFYRPYLTVIGFANMSDGIGRQSVEIMDTMRELTSVGFYPSNKSIDDDVPLAVQKIMKKRKTQLGKVLLYEDIIYSCSHVFFKKKFGAMRQDQVRLAYSMFESSEIPERWVHNLNTYFDAVVVPDIYLVETYKNSGVTIPIFVLPLGLNLQSFLQAPLKTHAHTPFVFANFSTCISRKNHRELIKAFYTAFGNSPDVQLWINSKYTEDHLFEILEQEVLSLGVSNIRLTNHCYDNAQYLKNFESIDCYVSISQAEGFSIQPREAMALGIPCIVSDNTAQSTICKSGLVTSIPCPIKELAYYEIFKEVFGHRYNIDFDLCVQALQNVYHDYDQHLSNAPKLREWAATYDYTALRSLYHTLLKPHQVILGTENKLDHDTLITSSQALYNKYQAIK